MDQLQVLRAVFAIGGFLIASPAAADTVFGGPDFNGDKVPDTVVGVPYESYQASATARGVAEAGAVDVVYGVAPGQPNVRPQHWTLASAGVPGTPAEGDHFGYAVAWGRFDTDPYPDLAIGIPGRDVDGIVDAGSVLILYGSPAGLVATGPSMLAAPRLLIQGREAVPGTPKHGDSFGFSLAAGEWWEYKLTSYLAIGAPGVAAGNQGDKGRGEVVVLYPDHDSLNQLWAQVVGEPEPGDFFGYSLAAGDFGRGFGFDADLAIGIPGEDVEGAPDAGVVEVLYIDEELAPFRLSSTGAQLLTQSLFAEPPQGHSWFGLSLSADEDTRTHLVIGEPWRAVDASVSAGVVHIIAADDFFTRHGLDVTNTMTVHPGRWITGGQVPGVAEPGAWFGFSVAAHRDWLGIGVPGSNGGDGAVLVLRGTDSGVTAADAHIVAGAAVDGQFGWSLNADRFHRLIVGAPRTLDSGGAVHVFTLDSLAQVVGKRTLTQDGIFGASEPTEPGDGFGASVGAGGFPWINFKF